MALEVLYTTKSGVDAYYHKITRLDMEYFPIKKVNMSVSIYKDQTASSNGNAPLEVVDHYFQEIEPEAGVDVDTFTGKFDSATLDVVNQNPQERGYVYLKTLPEYAGALDV